MATHQSEADDGIPEADDGPGQGERETGRQNQIREIETAYSERCRHEGDCGPDRADNQQKKNGSAAGNCG
jgi:hypothetical protein